MIIVPVDLRVCEHEGCGDGACAVDASPPLVVCWDCGSVTEGSGRTTICIACLLAYRQAESKLES